MSTDTFAVTIRQPTRDQIISRVQTHVVRDAQDLTGKGGVLSKDEQSKLEWPNVFNDAAREVRTAGGKGAQVRLDPLVDAAMAKVTTAVDGVDKPGRGHGTISKAEAREALATKGDVGERIGHAYEALTGQSLETKGTASPKLQKAVAELIQSNTFSVLSVLKGSEPTAWVQGKIESALASWGGDSGVMSGGRIKVGKETVHVATTSRFDDNKLTEMIGFFDKEGRTVGRAQIERNEDSFGLQMRLVGVDGKPGDIIAQAPQPSAAKPPEAWTKALEANLQKKFDEGEDLGTPMKSADLPKDVKVAFEFARRNTPDGVGLEKVEFEGKTAYAIHDYSCVSSVALYSEEGNKLFSFVS